jgi:hypothetical protein
MKRLQIPFISTISKSISQNFKLIGRTNSEKMRDMTQATDYKHDQYITALFFVGVVKKLNCIVSLRQGFRVSHLEKRKSKVRKRVIPFS